MVDYSDRGDWRIAALGYKDQRDALQLQFDAVKRKIKRMRQRIAELETTHEVTARPMTDSEQFAEQLTLPSGSPWLAECTCGARMLPLLPGEANAWQQGHLSTRPTPPQSAR